MSRQFETIYEEVEIKQEKIDEYENSQENVSVHANNQLKIIDHIDLTNNDTDDDSVHIKPTFRPLNDSTFEQNFDSNLLYAFKSDLVTGSSVDGTDKENFNPNKLNVVKRPYIPKTVSSNGRRLSLKSPRFRYNRRFGNIPQRIWNTASENTQKHAVGDKDVNQSGDSIAAMVQLTPKPTSSILRSAACELCKTSYTSRQGLRQHFRSLKHKSALNVKEEANHGDESVHVAHAVPSNGGNPAPMIQRKPSTARSQACDLCKTMFNSRNGLAQHLKSKKHQSAIISGNNQIIENSIPMAIQPPRCRLFVCYICKTIFATRQSLKSHLISKKHQKLQEIDTAFMLALAGYQPQSISAR